MHIVSVSYDNTARIWNTVTGECEAELKGHSSIVRSAVFSPDGMHIVSASDDHTAQIWNTATGECEAVLRHSNSVRSAVFSPDGMHIVSASYDNTAWIWNTATGQCEAELKEHSSSVGSSVFSPDRLHIVSASDNHTAQIWSTDRGECKHSLSLSANHQLPVILSNFGVYVHHDSYGGIYPTLQLSFLDMHGCTIFHPPNSQTLNIPPPFCGPTCVSYHLSKICLGYGSGEVLLLQVCMAIMLYFTLFLHCSIFFSEISSKVKIAGHSSSSAFHNLKL